MKWKVIVKGEDIVESFEDIDEAELKQEELSEKYKKVILISMDVKKPPADFKVRGSNYWCPYCEEVRRFKRDKDKKVKVCGWCGISENNYYVKKYNDLWGGY